MAEEVLKRTSTFMRFAGAIIWAATLHAQPLPTGFVRGVVVENLSSANSGDFTLRSGQDTLFRFRSDGKTWIEKENERIYAISLKPGELLEVVSDRDPSGFFSLHYARMVQVITQVKVRPPVREGLYRLYRPETERIKIPLNLTYTGIVIEITEREKMVIRTRLDGDKTFYFCPDTRFLEQGSEVDGAAIRPNTRVYVEAGKDADNHLEALQVVWGQILDPAGLRE